MRIVYLVLVLLLLYLLLFVFDLVFTAGRFLMNLMTMLGSQAQLVPEPYDIVVSALSALIGIISVMIVILVAKSIRKRGGE